MIEIPDKCKYVRGVKYHRWSVKYVDKESYNFQEKKFENRNDINNSGFLPYTIKSSEHLCRLHTNFKTSYNKCKERPNSFINRYLDNNKFNIKITKIFEEIKT